jgi:hypothetical protein
MDLQELVWAGMDWVYQAQDGKRWQVLVNVLMSLGIP